MTQLLLTTPLTTDMSFLPAALLKGLAAPALPAPICPPVPDTTLPPVPDFDELDEDLPEHSVGSVDDTIQDERPTPKLARSDRFLIAHGFRWHGNTRPCFWHHAKTGVRICRDPDCTNDQWNDAKIYGVLRALLIRNGIAQSPRRRLAAPQRRVRTDLFVCA